MNNIPDLTIERNDDGTVTLEQNWSGNVDRVAVHTVHVRYLAEMLGLIERPAPGADRCIGIAELKRDNDRLKRNMLRVHEHALNLQNDFRENADWKHADLTHEMGVINTLVDLLDMAVDDFKDCYTAHDPGENPRVSQREPSGPSGGHAPEASPMAAALHVAADVAPSCTRSRHSSVEQLELPA